MSVRKLLGERERQREGESLHADTSTVAGHTKEGLAMSDSQILKNKCDSAKLKKLLLL